MAHEVVKDGLRDVDGFPVGLGGEEGRIVVGRVGGSEGGAGREGGEGESLRVGDLL